MLTQACEASPMTGYSVMSSLHHGYAGSPVSAGHMGGSHYDEYTVYSPNDVMGGYYSRKSLRLSSYRRCCCLHHYTSTSSSITGRQVSLVSH